MYTSSKGTTVHCPTFYCHIQSSFLIVCIPVTELVERLIQLCSYMKIGHVDRGGGICLDQQAVQVQGMPCTSPLSTPPPAEKSFL